MKNYGVTMIREHMEDIPEAPFPKGFSVRNYHPGEGCIWTRIQRAAEPFIEVDDMLFQREFGGHLKEMEDRTFFVIMDKGEEIGTITAWWNPDWRGKQWGVIHWVAIHPDYQGRGLSKPAMTVAMKRLKELYDRCMLNTSTGRIVAIKWGIQHRFTFYQFERELHPLIHPSNLLERLFREFRNKADEIGAFPNSPKKQAV